MASKSGELRMMLLGVALLGLGLLLLSQHAGPVDATESAAPGLKKTSFSFNDKNNNNNNNNNAAGGRTLSSFSMNAGDGSTGEKKPRGKGV